MGFHIFNQLARLYLKVGEFEETLKNTKTPLNFSLMTIELRPQFRKSNDGISSNLLILLHGYGDTACNFIKFGQKLDLPQTDLVALNGPFHVPHFPGCYSWYHLYDEMGEEMSAGMEIVQSSLKESISAIKKYISSISRSYSAERIFIVGFSQGGVVAMLTIIDQLRIGGVVSISGFIPWEFLTAVPDIHCQTPVLITKGSKDEMISESEFQRSIDKYSRKTGIKLLDHVIPGKGHEMPSSSLEVRRIMEFLADKLYLRNPTLESMSGLIEIR
jgi:predicted esterase